MFEKSDKRRLYWLIELYLSNKINESSFCDEFYYSYSLEIDYRRLTKLEEKVFQELSNVSSRFSEFEEDHKLENVYYTKEELRSAIMKAHKHLTNDD